MRMVATDLDGTIVRRDGSVSARTLAAFGACERAGVDVVFVTGRPPRFMAPVVAATGHRGVAICSNGAVVVRLADLSVLRVTPLGREAVLEVADRLRAVLPGAVFAVETLDGYRREPGYVPRQTAARDAPTGPLEHLLADGPTVFKVLCRQDAAPAAPPAGPGRPSGTDRMLELARSALAGIAEPVHSDPASGMLEIAAAGVSKATGLAELAAGRGIGAADVVAFGDMPNDVAMLRWAGRGYAMDGGHPDALAAAPALAPPCDQDGVAQVLEQLLADRPAPGAARPSHGPDRAGAPG